MTRRLASIFALGSVLLWQSCDNEVAPDPVDCGKDPIVVELVSKTDSNCELTDGMIEVSATGGDGNYKFVLNGGTPRDEGVFTSVGAGFHTVTVIDGNTCSGATDVTVMNISGMNISFTTTDAGGCDVSNGTLSVNAFNGTEPYAYRLDNGAPSSDSEYTGLAAGVYALTVTDATGCEISQSIRIRSGVTFSGTIKSIVETKCAINDCHNGNQYPDFRVLKNIQDNAMQVKALTGDGTMPQEGSLTQTQINQIACWVDDGAPDN